MISAYSDGKIERMGKVETKGGKIFAWVNLIAGVIAGFILYTDDNYGVLFVAALITLIICAIDFFIMAIVLSNRNAERNAETNAELMQMAFQMSKNKPSSFVNPVINESQLRRDLQDYYGTAAYNGFPAAAMDAMNVDNMSTQELINQAQKNGFDMSK